VERFIISPEKFAKRFNDKVPGAYRQITTQDIRDMTECGLIKRYGHYLNDDIQTVINILNYEQLRQKRVEKQEQEAIGEPPPCKLCGRPLPAPPEDKVGRPKEYCPNCAPLRATERYKKWRRKRQIALP
jgi:hypothetical protein